MFNFVCNCILITVVAFSIYVVYIALLEPEIKFYKQNINDVPDYIDDKYGKLVASFYVLCAYRSSSSVRADMSINCSVFFNKSSYLSHVHYPKKVEIYERAMIINYDGSRIVIEKDRIINLKSLPVTNTSYGMFDLYGEYISIPWHYDRYYDRIWITDVLGSSQYEKLILTPAIVNVIKENFKTNEIIVEEEAPLPIN